MLNGLFLKVSLGVFFYEELYVIFLIYNCVSGLNNEWRGYVNLKGI